MYKKAEELNIGISQFGSLGKYMGVAKLNSEYRITNEKGILDFQATVENIKGIEKLMTEMKTEIDAHNKM